MIYKIEIRFLFLALAAQEQFKFVTLVRLASGHNVVKQFGNPLVHQFRQGFKQTLPDKIATFVYDLQVQVVGEFNRIIVSSYDRYGCGRLIEDLLQERAEVRSGV